MHFFLFDGNYAKQNLSEFLYVRLKSVAVNLYDLTNTELQSKKTYLNYNKNVLTNDARGKTNYFSILFTENDIIKKPFPDEKPIK